jgi:hypothetical protein
MGPRHQRPRYVLASFLAGAVDIDAAPADCQDRLVGEEDESAVAASPDRGTPDEASEAGG